MNTIEKRECLINLANLINNISDEEKQLILSKIPRVDNLDNYYYSYRNNLLLYFQAQERNVPYCTTVGMVKSWNHIDRKVKSGEKGFLVIKPVNIPGKNDLFFFGHYVFDILQTELIKTDDLNDYDYNQDQNFINTFYLDYE